MSHSEAIASQFIRKLKDGKKVFFPQGMFGRVAYVINSEKLEKDIRRTIKIYGRWLALGIFIMVVSKFPEKMIQDDVPRFFVFIVGISFLGWLVNKLVYGEYTKKMEKIKISNSIIDCLRDFGKKGNIFAQFFIVLFFGLISFAGLYFFLTKLEPIMLLIAIVMFPFFIGYLFALYHGATNSNTFKV